MKNLVRIQYSLKQSRNPTMCRFDPNVQLKRITLSSGAKEYEFNLQSYAALSLQRGWLTEISTYSKIQQKETTSNSFVSQNCI